MASAVVDDSLDTTSDSNRALTELQTPTIAPPKPKTSFLALPDESTIPEYLFIHGSTLSLLENDFPISAILQTCHQIREEASAVFFGLNKFVVELGHDFLEAEEFDLLEMLDWKKEIVGEERFKMIKSLEFRFRVGEDVDREELGKELCERATASKWALNLEKPMEEWNRDVFLNALPLVKLDLPVKVISIELEDGDA